MLPRHTNPGAIHAHDHRVLFPRTRLGIITCRARVATPCSSSRRALRRIMVVPTRAGVWAASCAPTRTGSERCHSRLSASAPRHSRRTARNCTRNCTRRTRRCACACGSSRASGRFPTRRTLGTLCAARASELCAGARCLYLERSRSRMKPGLLTYVIRHVSLLPSSVRRCCGASPRSLTAALQPPSAAQCHRAPLSLLPTAF